MENEKEQTWYHYRNGISSSARLAQQGDNEEALRLLDGAIARAMSESENRWVVTLSHHAAVISDFLGNLRLVKQYYEKSLAFNPENPRALEGLADVAKKQGNFELAMQYASRCYKALIEGNDFLKKEQLETLLKKWPEASQP